MRNVHIESQIVSTEFFDELISLLLIKAWMIELIILKVEYMRVILDQGSGPKTTLRYIIAIATVTA